MAYEDKVDVRGDGRVLIYKRSGLKNPKYQARIRVPNATGYKVVSTKTEDRREAERVALNLYEELYFHVKSGGSVQSKTFRNVFDEWVSTQETMGTTRHGGSWRPTVDRVRTYALTYFGTKKVDTIKSSDLAEYWLWRKVNFARKPPTDGTLWRERTALLSFFKFAESKGYITTIPSSDPPKAKQERRSTFTLDEWRVITRKARSWVKEGKKLATGRDRFIAHQYFLILANTGMRVGEARGIKWSDLRTVQTDEGPRLVAEVRGKTGLREVVFQSGSDTYVKRIYDNRCDELGDKPDDSEYVFCHQDGTPIGTFKRSFQSLISYSEVPEYRNGKKRTIYSLRHFYATQRLSNDTSPFLLAKQMGTSVEMLEKFYGQTVSSELAAQITKGRQRSTTEQDRGYPFE